MNKTALKHRAFTLLELLVVVAIVATLASLMAPALARTAAAQQRIYCANNLKQVSQAFKVWAASHNGRFPMTVSASQGGPPIAVTIAGSSTTTSSGYAYGYEYTAFLVMSNELSTPRLLNCPTDERNAGSNFNFQVSGSYATASPTTENAYFNNPRISYTVGKDAYGLNPQMILSSDRNIYGNTASQTPPTTMPNSGYGWGPNTAVPLGTNFNVTAAYPGWTAKMHQQRGNAVLVDGSVQQLDSVHLRDLLRTTGDTCSTPGQNTLLFP